MPIFYNSAQPQNISHSYSQFSQVDFVCRPQPGRQVVAGSFRLSGKVGISKTLFGATSAVPVVPTDNVFLDVFAGAHSFIKNVSCSINERIIENIAYYARSCTSKVMAENTLEDITSSSYHAPELKGLQNNVPLCLGTDTVTDTTTNGQLQAISFSIKPMIALNRSSTDLPVSRFAQMKIMMTLASALESLYCSSPQPVAGSADLIIGLNYFMEDVQLNWYEVPELVEIPRTVFKTVYLTTQTVVSLNTNLYCSSPVLYNAVACSFILQADRNKVYKNDLMCEYIKDIIRLEFTINGNDGPLAFAIGSGDQPPYQMIASNLHKALEGTEKNCLMNKLLSETVAFGIGSAFKSSQNDKLGIAITISDQTDRNPSTFPYDAFIYTMGFLEV